MARSQTFAHFDQAIADTFLATSLQALGLPGYLGVRFTEMTPGRLVATMEGRAELLSPFTSLLGGVVAGLGEAGRGCVR